MKIKEVRWWGEVKLFSRICFVVVVKKARSSSLRVLIWKQIFHAPIVFNVVSDPGLERVDEGGGGLFFSSDQAVLGHVLSEVRNQIFVEKRYKI